MDKKILFVYKKPTTFVSTDLEILQSNFQVTEYHFFPYNNFFQIAKNIIKQLIFLLGNIWKFDIVFIWFADYHAFLPIFFARIAGKKSFLVVGGFDVARIPHLRYGVFCSKPRGFLAKTAMKMASLNLSVSTFVDRKVKAITQKSNSKIVQNCIAFEDKPTSELKKENLILSVGVINSTQTFYIKGLDTFINVAFLLPQYQFMIIGLEISMLERLNIKIPKNLIIKPKVNHIDLKRYYQQAKVYCQLSRSESFGIALAESIHYGCIPIITDVGGMKEVAGHNALIVKRETLEIKEQIKQAMNSNESIPLNALSPEFTVKQRHNKLVKILNQ